MTAADKAIVFGSIYLGRGPWDGPIEFLKRTDSGHYFIHRNWHLFDGRRMTPDEIPWKLMGNKRDYDRLKEQDEIEPISRSQALLLCLEFRMPKDLWPELRKFIRSRKVLPRFRHQQD